MNSTASVMQQFFKSIDRKTARDPERLALAFARYYWDPQYTATHEIRDDEKGYLFASENKHNISILIQDTSLEFMTKRVPLVATSSVFTHRVDQGHQFFSDGFPPANSANTGWSVTGNIRCPSLTELGNWLRNCRSLLESGQVFYLPDIHIQRHEESGFTGNEWVIEEKDLTRDSALDLVVKNRQLNQQTTSDNLTTKINLDKRKAALIKPVLTVDLPCIEDVDLATFSDITIDENESLQKFRDFLTLKFLEMKQNEDSEFFDTNLTKISIELREGVRNLNSDFDLLQRKGAFQAAGATVAAVTASLVAINSAAFGFLPGVLGASGGALALTKALEDYLNEKHKIANSPYYYLWLFSKRLHRRK
jgi:hypothetical protein